MNFSEYFLTLGILLAGTITPGPNNALLTSSGSYFGYQKTLPHCFGIIAGMMTLVFTVNIGLGALYEKFPIFQIVLLIITIILLLYLAYKIATAPVETVIGTESKERPWRFIEALLFQWVNPKAWMIAISASGTIANPNYPFLTALTVTSAAFIASIISTQTWTMFGVAMRKILNTPLRRRLFNITMALFLLFSAILIIKI